MDDLWGPPSYYQAPEGTDSLRFPYDVIEDSAINEKCCIQVLNILIGKQDTDISELEDELMELLGELACTDVEFSDMVSMSLRGHVEYLDSSVKKLKDGAGDFSSTSRQPADSINDIMKSLFSSYLRKKAHQMTRLLFAQQRKRQMLTAMTAAIGTFNILSHMTQWFMLGGLIINYKIESRTLHRKYRMNFDLRRANMKRMVYESDVTSMANIRMDRNAFVELCKMLETRGGLCSSKHMLVDEQVAMLLHTLAHNIKNRIIVNRFQISGETISRYFKLVLDAVCRLHKEFYKIPMPIANDETDERWKWFKGCLGALDGTYIKVRVPAIDRKPYRTRKGEIATNVLGVCTRDLMFTYVLAGWEGSTADSRVLRDAISRPHGLKIAHGTYYLCDAGYTNGDGFLTPYRGQRYHLNDWSNPPTTAKELYNKKHSSARNVIERCFGLIKARWGILRGTSYHPVESMSRIIIACCLMHNFIRTNMDEDPLDNEVLTNVTQD